MKYYHKVNGHLSDDDVEELVQSAVASNRLEGLYTPPYELEMLRKYARGDITYDECMAWIWNRAGVVE